MRRFVGRMWLLLLVVVPLLGCRYTPTEKETKTVTELTSEMRTWGMGRLLIDLPASWEYGNGHTLTLYYGLGADFDSVDVIVIAQGMKQDEFESVVAKRADRISEVVNHKTNGSMLLRNDRINPRTILLRHFKNTPLDMSHSHEVHLLVNDVYVLFQANSYEGVIAPVEQRLLNLASNVSKVTNPERAGPGFILGPVLINGGQDHETATILFQDPARADLILESHISAMTPDSKPLFERGRQFIPMFDGSGVDLDSLRKDRLQIAGMEAEEQMLAADWREKATGQSMRGFLFAAETYRPKPELAKPTLYIKLEAMGEQRWKSDAEVAAQPEHRQLPGYWTLPNFVTVSDPSPAPRDPAPPGQPSLTEYEAKAVWDAIIKSIRPRQGAVAPSAERVSSVFIDPLKTQANKQAFDAWLDGLPRAPGES